MQPESDTPGDKLKTDLRTLVQDAEGLLKATAGDMSEKAKQARARLAGALDSAKATCARYEEKAREAAKVTDEAVRTNPYRSMGIAFGAGLVLGVVLARK